MITCGIFLAPILVCPALYTDSAAVPTLRVCFVRGASIYSAQRETALHQLPLPSWRIGVRFGDADLDKEYDRLMEETYSGTRGAPPSADKRGINRSHVAMEGEFKLSFAAKDVPEPGPDLFRYRFVKDAFYYTRSFAYEQGHMRSAGNYVIQQSRMLNKPTVIPRLLGLRVWPVEGPLTGGASAGFPPDLFSSSLDPKIKSSLKDTYCDFLPTADKEMIFAVLRKDGLRVWRGNYLIKPALAIYDPQFFFLRRQPCSWVPLNKAPLKCGWHEPFWLFGDERSLFLVTDSGRVSVVKFFKDRPCELKPLWPAKPAPVSLIVSDVDSGRTFAFAPDTPALSTPDRPVPAMPPRGFTIAIPGSYFELAEKLNVCKYDDWRLQNIPESNDAYFFKLISQYVELLQRQNKIGSGRK
jgi:hypothetical protein